MNTSSINPTSTIRGRRIADALARWLQRWADAIDAAPPLTGHRMGSWEASVSPGAQAVQKAQKTQKVKPSPSALSENG